MPDTNAMLINGDLFTNSAAKFWPRLIAETRAEFAEADTLELSAFTSGPLDREALHPELAFERDLERMLDLDPEEGMRRILAELEITGPPGAVRLLILQGDRRLAERELPTDCADAEILPYLIAWPLKWAGLPPPRWNDPSAQGDFVAEDLGDQRYAIAFRVTGKHLSEGLYRRSIRIRFRVESLDQSSADTAKTTAL
jgi:hypothetical protein